MQIRNWFSPTRALAVCALGALPLACSVGAEVEEMELTVEEAAPDPEDIAPWIVFAEESAVHAEPDPESDVLLPVQRGDEFFGEYYVHEPTDVEWLIVDVEEAGEGFLPRWHIHRIFPDNVQEGNIPIGQERVDRWWGLPLDYEPDDLVPTPVQYRLHQNENREYPLRADASAALVEMIQAGEADGVFIRVCSAYRSGNRQTMLYTRNVERRGPQQRSSAPPGHSEHQLGTCVDLCDDAATAVISQRFAETPEGIWMEENAARFGFRRSYYPHNVEETGYISEPWHWRYWGVGNLPD